MRRAECEFVWVTTVVKKASQISYSFVFGLEETMTVSTIWSAISSRAPRDVEVNTELNVTRNGLGGLSPGILRMLVMSNAELVTDPKCAAGRKRRQFR